MNKSPFEGDVNKIWGEQNFNREGIQENKGKKGKIRKSYPKFSLPKVSHSAMAVLH